MTTCAKANEAIVLFAGLRVMKKATNALHYRSSTLLALAIFAEFNVARHKYATVLSAIFTGFLGSWHSFKSVLKIIATNAMNNRFFTPLTMVIFGFWHCFKFVLKIIVTNAMNNRFFTHLTMGLQKTFHTSSKKS